MVLIHGLRSWRGGGGSLQLSGDRLAAILVCLWHSEKTPSAEERVGEGGMERADARRKEQRPRGAMKENRDSLKSPRRRFIIC